MKTIIQQLKIIVLAAVIGLGVSYAMAWTGPVSTPPADNVPAPINAGSSPQAKQGIFETYNDSYFATLGGKVGIGTVNPVGKLDIDTANNAKVRFLGDNNVDLQIFRDGDSNYKWDLSNRGTLSSPNDTLYLFNQGGGVVQTWKQNGNVGIGKTNPGAKLDVNGPIHANAIGRAGSRYWRGVYKIDSPKWADRWLQCDDNEILTGMYYNPQTWEIMVQCKKLR